MRVILICKCELLALPYSPDEHILDFLMAIKTTKQLALAISLMNLGAAALADEAGFNYAATADTLPAGENEFYTQLTHRWDKTIRESSHVAHVRAICNAPHICICRVNHHKLLTLAFDFFSHVSIARI